MASADTVTMTNGEVLEGVIEQEGDNSLVLNIGMGSITLKKSKITSIAREDEEANLAREQDWKTTYIKIEKLPQVLQALAPQFDSVAGRRGRALRAAKALPKIVAREETQENQYKLERRRHGAMTQQLAGMSPHGNTRAYNAKVEENNKLVARVNRLQANIERDRVAKQEHRESIAAYSQALGRLEANFLAALEDPAAHPAEDADIAAAWLEQAEKRLTQFQGDFQRMVVPFSGRPGEGTLVGVSINGSDPAPFILDTGASVVTVSETLARRLKLEFDRNSPRRLSMADGTEVEGYPVMLSSVAVGEAEAKQVEAVVLGSGPSEGIDGLLGMTFLQRFQMNFNASTGHLELTRLK